MHSPEIFVDEFMSFFAANGVLRIVLASYRAPQIEGDAPAPPERIVVGRISMPITTAQTLVLSLNDFLSRNGLDPAEALRAQAQAKPQ